MSKKYKHNMHKILILPVVLHGCQTWSVTLREERRLRVSEVRVLWEVSRATKDEVTGEWRRLHIEGLNNLYCSSNIIWVIK